MATRVRSYSKINLGLAIGPVRADGFHGLATLYQTLALHDLVTVSARRLEPGSRPRITLTTNHAEVPADARNTAWKMVQRALTSLGVAAEVARRGFAAPAVKPLSPTRLSFQATARWPLPNWSP